LYKNKNRFRASGKYLVYFKKCKRIENLFLKTMEEISQLARKKELYHMLAGNGPSSSLPITPTTERLYKYSVKPEEDEAEEDHGNLNQFYAAAVASGSVDYLPSNMEFNNVVDNNTAYE
jgi:hypothetical protein